MAQGNGAPVVKQIRNMEDRIVGMSALGGFVYVTFESKSDFIEIYDATLLEPVGRLLIRGSQKLRDIAASRNCTCLYVSDRSRCCVYRVGIPAHGIFKWDVNGSPTGVAVSFQEKVLVLNQSERKIQEYSTFGDLLGTIDLDESIRIPYNIAQMSTGELVVTYNTEHKGDSGGVCVMRADMIVCKQLQSPRGVIIGPNDTVVVAVNNSNQVVVFDKTLSRQKPFFDAGPVSPHCLCFDKDTDTLFYGEWMGQRMASFGNAMQYLAI